MSVLILIWYIVKINKKKPTKENFINESVPKKCIDLKPTDMGGLREETETSIASFIDTYRIQKYIPALSEDQTAMNNTQYQYCYMYYDSNNGYIDPILEEKTCDVSNPIFNSPLINRVFINSTKDNITKEPYVKCVMEINSNQETFTINNINAFWEKFGKTDCELRTNSLDETLRLLQNSNMALSNERHILNNYISCQSVLDLKGNALEILQTAYNTSNCFFSIGNCDGTRTQKQLVNDLNNKKTTLNNLNSQIVKANEDIKNYIAMTAEKQRLSDIYSTKINPELSNELRICSNIDVPNSRIDLKNATDELLSQTQSLELIQMQNAQCRSSESFLKNITNTSNSQLIQKNALYDTCNLTLANINSEIEGLYQEIDIIKGNLKNLYSLSNKCTTDYIGLEASKKTLVADVNYLTLEKDEWERKCKFNTVSSMAAMGSYISALRKSAANYTRVNCGNDMTDATEVNDLINKKFKSVQAVTQTPPCGDPDIESSRATCCKNNGYE